MMSNLDIERIRELVAERERLIISAHGPGRVVMGHCIMCGRLQWQSTTKGAETAVQYNEIQGESCERCTAVRMRAPEVFDWVVGVVMHLHEMRVVDADREKKL